jgi:hypothetical protein
VIRGARPGARKLALLAVILGIAGGIAFGIIGCVQGVGDADKYGRIPLPGDELVDLPEGEVALYYEERVTLAENDSLDSPDGIRAVAVRENTRVKSKKRGINNAISLDGRALDEWGSFDIPQAGRYRVSVRSKQPGSNQPAVTIGVSQTDNFVNAGLTVLFGTAGGLGVALIALLLGRIGYEPPKPWVPTATPQTAGAPPWGAPPGAPGAPAGGAAAGSPPASPTGGDPVEAQLRDLERRHQAGEIDGDEYQRGRRAVLDAAFGPPGG